MARTTVTSDDLREIILAEAARHSPCAGVYISGVEPHEPDATGCNWGLAGIRGSGDSQASAECIDALSPLVAELQRKYNLPETR